MYLADLHIHSRFSRATSKDCDAPHLDFWARRKGIELIGTGDFTHPAWRAELKQHLVEAGEGVYTLRKELQLPGIAPGETPRFILTGEISSIYKRDGKTRKVHNLILLPSLLAADELSAKLEAIGNIRSDGRPILGLDSRDLLELTMDTCPKAELIPAHIWTPHFSMFGAFSGFNSVSECFDDMAPYIHAVETGLSSDPPMNWRVSALDGLTLVSNSDAHSPAKLGREANLLDTELSYPALVKAIQTREGFLGTVEFFPEEGKYHLDGHRNCGVCFTPAQTAEHGGICPVCNKKLTIGVENRVEKLTDRPVGFRPSHAKPFESLAPLPEVIAASTGKSATAKATLEQYERMLQELGAEFYILRQAPIADIEQVAGPCIAEGINRLRLGKVERKAGFDGEYGTITLLSPSEIEHYNGQISLFGVQAPKKPKKVEQAPKRKAKSIREPVTEQTGDTLNPQQQQAVTSAQPTVAVIAGPGTGKTKTLVSRIAYLVEELNVKPDEITAVTFTNQAAAEMRQRLEKRLGGKRAVSRMTIGTFHSICYHLLGDVHLISQGEALTVASDVLREHQKKLNAKAFLQAVSRVKNGAAFEAADLDEDLYQAYCKQLQKLGVLDFDDLLIEALKLQFGALKLEPDTLNLQSEALKLEPETLNLQPETLNLPPETLKLQPGMLKPKCGHKNFTHLLVDEFQDMNEMQYNLIQAWNQGGSSLFVIGDPDQSIYSFRGASSRCIERMLEDFPETQEIRLIENYRSTPQIIQAALPIIEKNAGSPRSLSPNRSCGVPVRLVQAHDDFAESVFIAKEIGRMTGGVDMLETQQLEHDREILAFADIAVLCRTHRQLELIEKCLKHDDIPCVIHGREDFLDADDVRGVLSFFRCLQEPADTAALETALRLLWDCPADLIEAAQAMCSKQSTFDLPTLQEAMQGYEQLNLWLKRAEEWLPILNKEKPWKLIARWEEQYGSSPTLERLRNTALFHSDLQALWNALILGQEADLSRAAGKGWESGAVQLMTLHGAKGLEFPAVFVAGVKDKMLPLQVKGRPTDIQEERRLLYVGMTRAKQELIITTGSEPSAFLADLPNSVVQQTAAQRERPAEQLCLF